MDYRQLGHSGLKVSSLSFGAGTFGGAGDFFRAWGKTDVTADGASGWAGLEVEGRLDKTGDIRSEPSEVAKIPSQQNVGLSLERTVRNQSVVCGAADNSFGHGLKSRLLGFGE